ncbi:SPOR domain-containing protein [Flavobacterium psychrotolerans]|uniref:Sporulation protein n=1 Tax=Flavobacterium psychrotolerans TaxID=2169410 RepID=A0A2U1JKI6_9FLAO|nr:SPOR domain-containing protein [Flavobacterium psychrotolerans]PWA05666.1 sporulation protein [Flavobacterium psychrotolerans]
MRVLTFSKTVFVLITWTVFSSNLHAQQGELTVSQDPKFEQMLNEKRKINSSITVNDRYKIQIYNGTSEISKKTLNEFRRDNKNFDGTIVFSTPTYKVWVGNFKSRIEAERNLIEIKVKYPNAILIKPNK